MFYLLFIAPGLLLSLLASWMVKSAFSRYSKVLTMNGLTGAQAVERMLASAGVRDVAVERTDGFLSDHYNPLTKKLALSEEVYGSASIAAVGVACHEAGHAVQHANHYAPMWLRSALVPTANIGSNIGYAVMMIGLFMNSTGMVLAGAVLFSMVLLFQIVTLPVEFDASSRAKRLAVEYGIVSESERPGNSLRISVASSMTMRSAIGFTAFEE